MAENAIKFDNKKIVKYFEDLGRRSKDINERNLDFWTSLAAIAMRDVDDHFAKEAGKKGPWKKWSDLYAARMRRIGKGGNKILQDDRTMFKQIQVVNSRNRAKKGQLLFNRAKTKSGYPYAWGHNEGDGKLPQRKYFWLSDKAAKAISLATLAFLSKGKK